MRIEEEHPDVLQNIEFLVAQHYRAHPDMTDYAVARVYEALLDSYAAEKIGREPRPWTPTEVEKALFGQTKEMCDWWLGRNPDLDSGSGTSAPPPREIDLDTLNLCLKRLRKSVQKWTKREGRQGYLRFIVQFLR